MNIVKKMYRKWAVLRMVLLSFTIFLGSSGFMNPIYDESEYILTTLQSEFFDQYVKQFYADLEGDKNDLSEDVLKFGLRGYYVLRETEQLNNDRYLTLIDFSMHSYERRMWIIDVMEKKVVVRDRVAHGKMSGDEYATKFSNNPKSKMSSLGFYLTGNPYNGSNGLSLKLHGLEKGFNHNAFARGVVIHGANYMEERFVENNMQKAGRSFGCPAVTAELNRFMVDELKDESCLFIYHPTHHYLLNSSFINANLFIPIDNFL